MVCFLQFTPNVIFKISLIDIGSDPDKLCYHHGREHTRNIASVGQRHFMDSD